MAKFRINYGKGEKTKTIRELRNSGLTVSESEEGAFTEGNALSDKVRDFIMRHVLSGTGNFPKAKERGAKEYGGDETAMAKLKARYQQEVYDAVYPHVKQLFRFSQSSWAERCIFHFSACFTN